MKRFLIFAAAPLLIAGNLACKKNTLADSASSHRMVMVAQGGTGVGGAWTLHYYAYQLRSDGTYYALYRTGQSPDDLDVQQFEQEESARYWGSWESEGGSLTLKYGDGSGSRTYADGMWFGLDPGKKGERLPNGRYTSVSGSGNTAWGGNVVTSSITQYWFDTQGRFSFSAAVSGSTGNATGMFIDGTKSGNYEIEGYTITFTLGNGHTERRLFYFWRGGNQMSIGIGSQYFNAPQRITSLDLTNI